jgi:hypothetical protein
MSYHSDGEVDATTLFEVHAAIAVRALGEH